MKYKYAQERSNTLAFQPALGAMCNPPASRGGEREPSPVPNRIRR